MDIFNTINPALTQNVLSDETVCRKDATQVQKEQFAKDFESVFIEKLLDEMKNTIGSWGGDQDAASQQIQGIFWMHLARDVSANGGLGMWKNIYDSLNQLDHPAEPSTLLNDAI